MYSLDPLRAHPGAFATAVVGCFSVPAEVLMPSSVDPKARAPHELPHASGRKAWLLALLLFLFVLPLMGGTYWMYLQSEKEIENRELQGDLVRARTLAAMVDQDLA